jgi:hypothetical protein
MSLPVLTWQAVPTENTASDPGQVPAERDTRTLVAVAPSALEAQKPGTSVVSKALGVDVIDKPDNMLGHEI